MKALLPFGRVGKGGGGSAKGLRIWRSNTDCVSFAELLEFFNLIFRRAS